MTEENDRGPAGAGASEDGDEPAASGPAFGGAGTAIREHWEEFIADMETTAAELREDGWEVLELHPGDVTVVTRSHRGFDVLVPDDEFERLREWVAGATFPEHDVYRAEAGIVFLLVVMRDPGTERAVCCPLYYEHADTDTLSTLVEADGELRTHVRRLSDEFVHFVHDDPEPFFGE